MNDRNVYAAFTATVRTYTVRFYINNGINYGTSLLQTVENVPYGGMAVYTGTTPDYGEPDYEFTGWSPNPSNITGNTDCYAQYKYTGLISTKLVERTLSGAYTNETIESIGDMAFAYCTSLTSVSFPVATSMGSYAFASCTSLTTVNFPKVTSIGTGAFEGWSNLKSVILYEGVINIGENAFKGCNCIIYYKCDSIPETWNKNWNPDNCIVICGEPIETWDISATSNDNVTAYLIDAGDDRYELLISGNGNMVNYNSFNATPWYSDYNYSITSIAIYDSVTSIGDYTFSGCSSLTSITIPDSVTSIGNSAFYNCYRLTSITIPDSVTSISDSAFKGCKALTSIVIPDSVTSIGKYAFEGCSGLTSIIISDSVTSIVNFAFNGCSSLTSITIPDSVTSIGDYAFGRCSSLTSIIIPDSVTSIGNYTFYYCSSLTSITYTGTISQWNTITKVSNWNGYTGNYTIHCTDGDIAKS
jgi:hypothetical protein